MGAPGGERTFTQRRRLYDLLALAAASLVMLGALFYAGVVDVYDSTTLFVCIILPLVAGSVVFLVAGNRVLLFAFLAYFWTIVDDRPIFFDSVLTWPNVTRFHPFIPRLFMNIVIHALTAFFLYLVVKELLRGTGVRIQNAPSVLALASLAFVLSYAQNIPLSYIQNVVQVAWYPFDIVEKLLSFLVLYAAVRQAHHLVRENVTETAT